MVLVHTEKGSNLSEAKMSNFKFTHGEHHRYGITFVEKVIKKRPFRKEAFFASNVAQNYSLNVNINILSVNIKLLSFKRKDK